MLENINILFDESKIESAVMINTLEAIIYDYDPEAYGNVEEAGKIIIAESYELGDIDEGSLEEALSKLAKKFKDNTIRVFGTGNDAGSMWRFEATCVNGIFEIKKSGYYQEVFICDYDQDEYKDFLKWGFGNGMSKADFLKYKADNTRVLYRNMNMDDNIFYATIPIE